MNTDNLEKQLHDRATRGGVLSAEEQTLLDQWYARLDQEESAMLGKGVQAPDVEVLQAKVAAAVAQLSIATQRIHDLATENETLRHKIAILQGQLSQQTTTQSA